MKTKDTEDRELNQCQSLIQLTNLKELLVPLCNVTMVQNAVAQK